MKILFVQFFFSVPSCLYIYTFRNNFVAHRTFKTYDKGDSKFSSDRERAFPSHLYVIPVNRSSLDSSSSDKNNVLIRQPDNRKGDNEDDVAKKRNHVRNMMKSAWDVYAKHAWGYDEVKPNSGGINDRHGSRVPMGTSIIDSMSTLYIMGLEKEFEKGKEWIKEHFDFNKVQQDVSVFETNIRFVGG